MSAWSDAVLAHSPAGFWRHDEASGLIQDSSGNARHATSSGGADNSFTYQETGALESDTASKSIRYNNNSFMVVPDNAALDATDTVSIGAWVKREASGVRRVFIEKGTNSYLVDVTAGNNVRFVKSGVAVLASSSNTLTADGNFHFVVACKDATNVNLYIDAVDVTSGASNAALAATAIDVFIGGESAGNPDSFWDGWLDEVFVIIGTKLSSAQVTSLYDTAQSYPVSIAWLSA